MPEQLSSGLTFTDLRKQAWTIGSPIGRGGFGLIYLGRYTFFFNFDFSNIRTK